MLGYERLFSAANNPNPKGIVIRGGLFSETSVFGESGTDGYGIV